MSDMYLVHSAKGTSWKNHKYVKVVNGKYYYSNDMKGEVSYTEKTEPTKTTTEEEDEVKHSMYVEDYLEHHGVLGQKWGVRRYQNYDGTLIKNGSSVHKKTKYTNIDGSLNEKGKIHSQKYINKQISKNEKYYNKYISKYNKYAEKYSDDPELSTKFKNMAKDAERSRDEVNNYIKGMGIDEISSNEADTRNKVMKVVGAVGGTAATAALGVALPAAAVAGAGYVSNALMSIDPMTGMSKIESMLNTPAGKKAQDYTEAAIRMYSDANAYVFSIYADQALTRLDQSGVLNKAGQMAGQAAGNFATQVGTTAGQAAGNAATRTVEKAAMNSAVDLVSSMAKAEKKVK